MCNLSVENHQEMINRDVHLHKKMCRFVTMCCSLLLPVAEGPLVV